MPADGQEGPVPCRPTGRRGLLLACRRAGGACSPHRPKARVRPSTRTSVRHAGSTHRTPLLGGQELPDAALGESCRGRAGEAGAWSGVEPRPRGRRGCSRSTGGSSAGWACWSRPRPRWPARGGCSVRWPRRRGGAGGPFDVLAAGGTAGVAQTREGTGQLSGDRLRLRVPAGRRPAQMVDVEGVERLRIEPGPAAGPVHGVQEAEPVHRVQAATVARIAYGGSGVAALHRGGAALSPPAGTHGHGPAGLVAGEASRGSFLGARERAQRGHRGGGRAEGRRHREQPLAVRPVGQPAEERRRAAGAGLVGCGRRRGDLAGADGDPVAGPAGPPWWRRR